MRRCLFASPAGSPTQGPLAGLKPRAGVGADVTDKGLALGTLHVTTRNAEDGSRQKGDEQGPGPPVPLDARIPKVLHRMPMMFTSWHSQGR